MYPQSRSYRIKCGCMYFNSQVLLSTTQVVFSIHKMFSYNKTSRSSVPFWTIYSIGLEYSTGNKYLSRIDLDSSALFPYLFNEGVEWKNLKH